MQRQRWSRLLLLLLLLGASLTARPLLFAAPSPWATDKPLASIYAAGSFQNTHPVPALSLASHVGVMWTMLTEKSSDSAPDRPLETLDLSAAELLEAPDLSLWRLGHSTVLLKLEGKFWLTDPVFSERASPLAFAGPKRFHAPPIALDALPEIEAVILSHDHYDHLDHDTIVALAPKVERFLTPLGVGDRLLEWGVPAAKIRQLDWWEETRVGTLTLVATPAQHFSGRSLGETNPTLWASWVLIAPDTRLFFGGDGGYFDGFKTIGERFGPFALTLLENGAYNPAWPAIHMQPEQTVQAHLDLRGQRLVPIHNATFDLALHAWSEPLERIAALARQRDISLSTPRIGERLDIRQPAGGDAWWCPGEQRLARVQHGDRGRQTCL